MHCSNFSSGVEAGFVCRERPGTAANSFVFFTRTGAHPRIKSEGMLRLKTLQSHFFHLNRKYGTIAAATISTRA